MSSTPPKQAASLSNPIPSSSEPPENRKARRRRESERKAARKSTDAAATPLASGSSSREKTPEKAAAHAPADANPFAEVADFIPFGFDDDDEDNEDDAEAYKSREKGKAREETDEAGRSRNRRTRREERERDRGKSKESPTSSSHKRKRVAFALDDEYANKKQRVNASSRKSPWVADVDWDRCRNVAEMMHEEVKAFVNWISPTPEEDEVRGLIVSLVADAVKRAFPDAEVLPFGSYQTKLYLPLGDIDLVINSDSMAYSDKLNVLHALANTLKRAGITSNVTIIAKAKVPIVKFVTTHGRFNVDISVNQGNGIMAGKIVNGFLKDMHGSGLALRSLVMITKAFLSQRSMNEVFTGGLGSYSIVCMAVSFLQMHPKIRRGEIDAEKNLGVLAMEFFELYGCYFNYDEVGISLREGGTYFSKRQRGWFDYGKRGLLSIEDPTDPTNDISRGSYGFPKVKATLAGAHGIMTATAYLRAGMISSRKHGRSFRLREEAEYRNEDLSILASVMGITQETINCRKLVKEVYDKRTLHNLLGVQPQARPENGGNKSNGRSSTTGDNMSSSKSKASGSDGGTSSSSKRQEARETVNSLGRLRDDYEEGGYGNDYYNTLPEDDDGGRYGITERHQRQQPPRKRRKTGGVNDAHTIYLADEDGDSEEGDSDEDDKLSYEDVRRRKDGDYSRRDPEVEQRRRSYWLSKGIGIEGDHQYSD